MHPQIDQVYVYRPNQRKTTLGTFSKLNHRHIDDQMVKFKRGNIIEQSNQVHRYAKTYDINRQPRTLLLLTLDGNKRRVGTFLNGCAVQIPKDERASSTAAKADTKPLELSLNHVY